jgi:hypothetical protein
MSNKLDLGIIAVNLQNNSETSDVLNFANKYFEAHPYNQVCIFNSSSTVIGNNTIPIFHLNQAKFFYGNLLVMDIFSLEISNSFPNIFKRIFFAQDIPWKKEKHPYTKWEKILQYQKQEYEKMLTWLVQEKSIPCVYVSFDPNALGYKWKYRSNSKFRCIKFIII